MSVCFDLLQQIAHLNKVGVSCLASGSGADAVRAFKQALGVMAQVTQHPESSQLFQSRIHACSPVPIHGMKTPFYLYSNGLVFEASTDIDIAFVNSVILFNLALAFHQRGLQCGREQALRKALSLYDLSTQLISDLSACSGALLLVALNNSAQIQFELGEYQCSCETLQMLEGEAVHLPLADCSSAVLGQEHIDQIFLNVALTKPPMTAASA
ncbi:expressed unknown protein [Seminavis robusta]|uniref:Uncharacterized protein n=1 Tax=Seminavis robusta TaxID=568900 RepID=A0A9N8EJH1_9STRA|nr:expressed unknown protein [Seminavis robusta]|eukprot:Sro1344_g264730.1 n/a (212) ;mRNA; r:24720-25355